MTRLRPWLLVLLLISSCGVLAADAQALKDLDGKQHLLSEYAGQGRWLVVNVWSPACPFCRRELPDLGEFHDAHRGKDASVLGVTIDFPSYGYPDPGVVRAFATDYFVEFPLLLADAKLASRFVGQPVSAIPVSFIYRPDGSFAGRWNGVITRTELERIITTPRP